MNRERLEKLIARYDRQAETAYQTFQDTGITRYDTTRRNAEDMADALRMALTVVDDHTCLVTFRCSISTWAAAIQSINRMPEEQAGPEIDKLLREILATAKLNGLCREE